MPFQGQQQGPGAGSTSPIPQPVPNLLNLDWWVLSASSEPLECSAGFIAASKAAWITAGIGLKSVEAGFWVTGSVTSPSFFALPFTGQTRTITDIKVPPNAVALAHTHPNAAIAQPSPGDILNSNKSHLPFYVLSSRGLWLHLPVAASSSVLRPDQTWLKPCKKE